MDVRKSRILRTIPLFIAVCLLSLPAQAKYAGGTGVAEDPYVIATKEDLLALAADANDYAAHFVLTADIDLSGQIFTAALIAPDTDASYWFDGTAFTGVFDGNGHKITGLTIDDGGARNDFLGLFGCSRGGRIRNLGIEGSSVSGDGHVGGLVGRNESCDVSNCYSTADVNGYSNVGCLIGSNSGIVSKSYSTGNVNGEGSTVGGLVGDNLGIVWDCYATGGVIGEGSDVGGLVGSNSWNGIVSNCYSACDVYGRRDVGGLVGENSGIVWYCCSTGDASGDFDVGGLVGENLWDGTVSNCFWDTDTQSHGVVVGIGDDRGTVTNVAGRTTAQMQTEGTFTSAGWDFIGESANGTNETWQMPAGGGYPVLSFFHSDIPAPLAGSGTAADPFLIGTAGKLGMVNWYADDCCFKLTSDIDLSGISWSVPIVPVFRGHFDGDEHIITNMQILGFGSLGMFGHLREGGRVTNLGLEEGSVTTTGHYVGGLVGANGDWDSIGGTITNCHWTGYVSGDGAVGGLVGQSHGGTISDCYSIVDVNATGWYVGGLVGENGDWSNPGAAITNCYSRGNVSGYSDVGGLVGRNYEGDVSSCYSIADVNGIGQRVGGLAGCNWYSSVSNCYSTGDVNGLNVVGGLVGSNNSSTIRNCYSVSSVSGGTRVGGLCGEHSVAGAIINSFWDKDTSGSLYSAGGWAMSTAEM
ncbi:MAG: GLUG motif-containing protein, partial [Phycisphaerales bacterium]